MLTITGKRYAASVSSGAAILALLMSSTAMAHVVVKPADITTSTFQTFTMGVPNEKTTPTTSIKLLIPDGVQSVSPTQKAGWNINVEKTGSGEAAVTKSITWSGNTIGVGFRDDFTFSAKAPSAATQLDWKAYQTYQDGTVVAWDQKPGTISTESANAGPYSITNVTTQNAATAAQQKSDQAAADARSSATRALAVAIAALALGIVSLIFATRKK